MKSTTSKTRNRIVNSKTSTHGTIKKIKEIHATFTVIPQNVNIIVTAYVLQFDEKY